MPQPVYTQDYNRFNVHQSPQHCEYLSRGDRYESGNSPVVAIFLEMEINAKSYFIWKLQNAQISFIWYWHFKNFLNLIFFLLQLINVFILITITIIMWNGVKLLNDILFYKIY